MRDFGASRYERRPDVRFRGIDAAWDTRTAGEVAWVLIEF
jgi:hypothetical protein